MSVDDPVRNQVMSRLARCRAEIDGIDVKLVALLNERTRVVEEIGQIKQSASMPVYEPKREDEVYRNVTGCNRGPLPADSLKRIFERIIDEMRTVQRERMKDSK
jgi:chorismate mutase-like protein